MMMRKEQPKFTGDSKLEGKNNTILKKQGETLQDAQIAKVMELDQKQALLSKKSEMIKYKPISYGKLQKINYQARNIFFKREIVPDHVLESVVEKQIEGEYTRGRTIVPQQTKQISHSATPDATPTEVPVFPYLQQLYIKGSSVTEHSLIQILQKLPFNGLFEIQTLFEQYSSGCRISDETVLALANSPYLRNIKVLDLSSGDYSCDTLSVLIGSCHCINIVELRLNCKHLNESTFMNLATTKNFPKLKKIKAINFQNCYNSLGYLARAKYFDLDFDLEQSTLLREKIIYQSNKFINNLIGSVFMRNIKELNLDNMNDHMPALKEFFQLAKNCQALEILRLRNILDKVKYYYTWQELASSPCFPNLRSLQIEHIRFTENLNVLLAQKHKPLLNLNEIIQSDELIQESTLATLSKQQILLNSSHLSLQKLRHISKGCWDLLASSIYSYNIKSIDFSFDSLSNEIANEEHEIPITKNENKKSKPKDFDEINDAVEKGYLKPISESGANPNALPEFSSKLEIILRKGFVRLESLIIQNCESFSSKELDVIIQAEQEGKLPPKFDMIGLLNQLAEQYQLFCENYTPEQEKHWDDIQSKLDKTKIALMLRKYKSILLRDIDLSFLSMFKNPQIIEEVLDILQLEFVNSIDLFFTSTIFDNILNERFLRRCKNLKQLSFVNIDSVIAQLSNNSKTQMPTKNQKESVSTLKKQSNEQELILQKLLEFLKSAKTIWKGGVFDFAGFLLRLQGLFGDYLTLELAKECISVQSGNSFINIFIPQQTGLNDTQLFVESLSDILAQATSITITDLGRKQNKKTLSQFLQAMLSKVDKITSKMQVSSLVFQLQSKEDYKMSSEQFAKMCAANWVSQDFDLISFMSKNVEEQFTLKQFENIINLPCYAKITHLILPILDFDDGSMDEKNNSDKIDEFKLEEYLKLSSLGQLQAIYFNRFQNISDSDKLLKDFLNSNFITQRPDVILEFNFPVAHVIADLLGAKPVSVDPEQSTKKGQNLDGGASKKKSPSRKQGASSLSQTNTELASKTILSRIWQREVKQLLDQCNSSNENQLLYIKTILENPETRNYLSELDLNQQLILDMQGSNFSPSIFELNSIKHIHFSCELCSKDSHLINYFSFCQSVISVSFDQKQPINLGDKEVLTQEDTKNRNKQSNKRLALSFALKTNNVEILDAILQRYSSEITKQTLIDLTKNELIKQLTHVSFRSNKYFEIASIQEKLRHKTGKQTSSNKLNSQQSQALSKNARNTQQNQALTINSLPQTFTPFQSRIQEGIGANSTSNKFTTPAGNNNDNKKNKINQDDLNFSERALMQSVSAIKKVKDGEQTANPLKRTLIIPSSAQNSRIGGTSSYQSSPKNTPFETELQQQQHSKIQDQILLEQEQFELEQGSQNESEIKKYEGYSQEDLAKLIDENTLNQFLSKLYEGCSIDFSSSSVKHEHLEAFKGLAIAQQLTFINFKNCSNLSRVLDLLSFLSNETNPRFEFVKFLENLPYTEMKHRKQFKKLIENIIKTAYFKKHVRFFSVEFIQKIILKGGIDCYKGVFDPIINSKDRLNFNMTAFMQCLPVLLKQQVEDEFIEFLTKNYSPIKYLQPEHFNQVHYALNLIVQQRSVSGNLRIMYLLNPRFQKCISATSFELIFESLIVHDEDLYLQQKNLMSMCNSFVKQYVSTVKKIIQIQKRLNKRDNDIEALLFKKQDEIKQKLNINKKLPNSEKDNAQLDKQNDLNKTKIMRDVVLNKGRQPKERKINEGFDKEKLREQKEAEAQQIALPLTKEQYEEQEKQQKKKEEEEKNKKKIQKEKERVQRAKMRQRIDDQLKDGKVLEEEEEEINLLEKEDKKKSNQADEQQEQTTQEIIIRPQKEEEEVIVKKEITPLSKPQGRKSSIASNHSVLPKKARFQTDERNNINEQETPLGSQLKDKFRSSVGQLKGASASEINKPSDSDKQKKDNLVEQQMKILQRSQKQMFKSDFMLVGINKLKNSDKSLITDRENLLGEMEELEQMVRLMNEHLLFLEYRRRQMRQKTEASHELFEFFDSLNLSYNKYFNQSGLNKYIANYIQPWLNMNTHFKEINHGKFINLKVFTQKTQQSGKIFPKELEAENQTFQEKQGIVEDNQQIQSNKKAGVVFRKTGQKEELKAQIQSMLKADHRLDDAILLNLTQIIHEKMTALRKINMSGLNVGDEFAAEFSLVLADQSKLTSLKRLQLFHNRRISSFGLKFLFSSIVKRIPQGFKIDISPSLYDFQCLQKSIYLLEREFVQKLYRLSKNLHDIEKKEFETKAALLDQFAPKKKNPKEKDQGTAKPTPEEQEQNLNDISQQSQHPDVPNEKNALITPIAGRRQKAMKQTVVTHADELLEQRVRQAIENHQNLPLFQLDNQDLSEDSSFEDQSFNKEAENVQKKKKKDPNNEEEQEEGEDEENEDEEILLQLKAIEAKKDIVKWQLLSFDGQLSQKLIDEFEKKNGNDGKKLINQIISLRIKYEKSLLLIKAQNIEEDEDEDNAIVIQNLVNEGFYDTVNYILKRQDQTVLITLGVIFFPFALFHFFQVITRTFYEWVNVFQFDELINFSFLESTYSVELTKMVPATVGSQDFYFDEDVARLNTILRDIPAKSSQKRHNLNCLKKFLRDPIANRSFFERIGQSTQEYKIFHILNYSKWIFLFTFLLFQIGMSIVWPYLVVTVINKDTCDNISWKYDIPFYASSLILVIIEIIMLENLQKILAVKQIFSLKSALVVVLTYSSFMARYDQYTDMTFTFKTLRCEKLHNISGIYGIGVASITVMSINLFFQFLGFIWELILVFLNSRDTKKQLHNTNFINQFTKIALISEFYGVGISLDRFSTSSANSLNFWPIPKVLRSVKIPQIFLSKFQRVFLEDIPMIIILFIYNTYYIQSNWYNWDNLKVILTTIINLYNSLSQAWIARPSIFRTYMMQEYLEFREQYQDIYRLKITLKNFSSKTMEYEEIYSKIEEFLRLYNHSDQSKKALGYSEGGAGEASQKARTRGDPSGKSESNKLSDNNSKSSHSLTSQKRDSQSKIDENKDNQSKQSKNSGGAHNESAEIEEDKSDSASIRDKTQQNKKITIQLEDDYKRKLYEYILGSEKQSVIAPIPLPFSGVKKQRTKLKQ